MARPATKSMDNPYYQARLRAAERDTAYESRMSAGALVGISSTRLYQIERGLQQPHRDELIIMAEEYDAPELLELYCEAVCPVGQRCMELRQKKEH